MTDHWDDEATRLRNQLADLDRRTAFARGALTDGEMRSVREAQERADDVYRGLGLLAAPPPLAGELPWSYRARLAEGLQKYAYDPNLRAAGLVSWRWRRRPGARSSISRA
jgi:hypothetical protein